MSNLLEYIREADEMAYIFSRARLNEAELTDDEIKRLFKTVTKDTTVELSAEDKNSVQQLINMTIKRGKEVASKISKKEATGPEARKKLMDLAKKVASASGNNDLLSKAKGFFTSHKKAIVGAGLFAVAHRLYKQGKKGSADMVAKKIGDIPIVGAKKLDPRESVEVDPVMEGIFGKFSSAMKDLADNMLTSVEVGSVGKPGRPNEDDSNIETLLQAWVRAGRPTDSKEIIKVLKQENFSTAEIKQAFLDAGIPLSFRRDEIVIKLSQIIKKHKLRDLILQDLQKRYNIKESLTESISFDYENIITESTLSDSDIKNIFSLLVNAESQDNKKETVQDLGNYIKDWAQEINRANTKEERINLIREVVNKLSDRKNSPDWKAAADEVEDIIAHTRLDPDFYKKAVTSLKAGKVLEKTAYLAATYLLSECNLTWGDLSVKPMPINENQFRLELTIGKSLVLIEDVFQDVIAYNKLRKCV